MTGVRSRLALFTTLALLAGVAVSAQGPDGRGPGRGRGGPGGPGGPDGLLPVRQLNLTSDQQQQVKTIRESHQAGVRQAEEALRKLESAQRLAVRTVPANEGQIRTLAVSIAEAQGELAVLQARMFGEVWNILTPEQQTKLKALESERGGPGRGGRRPI